MNNKSKNRENGFTLIELLVVISIIALLSTVVVAAVSSARDKAKITKTNYELAEFSKMVQVAQNESGTTLIKITNNGYTANTCLPEPDWRVLPESHACRVNYLNSLTKIVNATNEIYSSSTIDKFKTDEWGSPYYLDENQGEAGICSRIDTVRSVGSDGTYNTADDISIYLPKAAICP